VLCGAAMASDKDDLEHELRHNLKLRRKLGVQAGKAEAAISGKQGGGVVYRLGLVLYWTCLVLAVALGLFVWRFFSMDSEGALPLIAGGLIALLFYGLGRAFRYVLSGE
jgi:hypothetical protein